MDPIITLDHVSMAFNMDMNKTSSWKEWFISLLKGKHHHEKFHALHDVSFTVQRGEVIGIVGQNGSGKSTILKVISGIYKPSSGKVVTAGRVAPMLELGSGFDPELTGHENIFLNGAVLGFGEQFLKDKYNEILEFSELEEFIHQPLKTYSSGMMMRLAFAVATMVEPEILIVDEILAVGDERFQRKSGARMEALMSGGTTVLMVSHNIDQIRTMCDRALWLDHGRMVDIGPADRICDAYQEFMTTME